MNNNKFFLTNFLFEGEVKPLGGDQLIEEIYKDALNWREENQDKYEEAAVDSLKKEKIYQIPIGPSLNLASPDIANGVIFFDALNIKDNNSLLKKASVNFDYQTRKFKPEFLEQYKNTVQKTNMSLLVVFDKLSKNKSSGGSFFTAVSFDIWETSTAKMQIDPIARPGEEIKSTIRHELQHGVQNINSICLAYARKLKDPKITDISSIANIISKQSAKGSYGVGSTVTGLRQGEQAEQSVANYSADPQGDKVMQELFKSFDSKTIAYLGDDFEYTTWKSDTLDQIINNFVKKYAVILNPKIMAINRKEYGNIASKPAVFQIFDPDQRKMARTIINSPARKQLKENLYILSREPTSIADLANLILKDFLESPSLLTGNEQTTYFVETVMLLKPKEFVRNMTIDLVARLKNYAKEIGATMASGAEQSTTQQQRGGRTVASKQIAQQNIQKKQAAEQAAADQQSKKQQTAAQQQQLEQQFRTENDIVPRNPRKHPPEDNFDDSTGQKILEPEQYRQQFQKWLAARQQPVIQTESISLYRLLYNKTIIK